MNSKKKLLVAASIAGLMAASSTAAFAGAAFPGQDAGNKSRCEMNGCKGAGSCKSMKKSCSGKGSDHACGGKNACKGQNGCKSAAETAAAAVDGTLAGK